MLWTVVIVVALACALVFRPYGALRWRTDVERWTTRERSYGHPYYMLMRFGPHCDERCGAGDEGCAREGWVERHPEAYNRRAKAVRVCKNVVYVE